ncbi:tetratricopeptide repeat protein [Halopseudomonas litoralis]|uniref:tetratricopeptide repeat protein n=1 Tax=Halopseudomonas litoralis TaxID=797277 RepID=UPI0012FD42DB|nr:SEL1-like repeat protein [Halopseudomonas litoralis]
MDAISLDTAILITGISKRTLWRRVTEGQLTRLETDERGRAMVAFSEIAPQINIPIEPEDYELLVDADAGDADAQNDLAQLLIDINLLDMGMHWLKQAVDQEHPDAMHNLAKLHFKGIGVPKDENAGLMWLAKASAHGHVIARQQMDALVSRTN